MKTVLLYANDDDGRAARFEAAIDLTRAFGGHLTCLHVTPPSDYVALDAFGGAYVVGTVLEQMETRQAQLKTDTETRLARESISWDFAHTDSPLARALVDASRLADVIVLSLPAADSEDRSPSRTLVGDVALRTRAPILAIPARGRRFDPAGPALIAWNGSHQAANAVKGALPLLRLASAIDIVTVAADDGSSDPPATGLSEFLGHHGLKSTLHALPREGRPASAAIRAVASEVDAAWLVMGAYGHSRTWEFVLGGVTRSLLEDPPLPLLLAH